MGRCLPYNRPIARFDQASRDQGLLLYLPYVPSSRFGYCLMFESKARVGTLQ